MSEESRESLKTKEQRKNPGAALNNTWAQARIGAPSSGCLVNMGSVVIVVVILLLVRACSN